MDDDRHKRADRGIESDTNPRARRIRLVVLLGVPTLVAAWVLVLLGLPAWLVAMLLVAFFLVTVLST